MIPERDSYSEQTMTHPDPSSSEGNVLSDAETQTNASSSADSQLDRRTQMERHWSTSNLSSNNRSAIAGPPRSNERQQSTPTHLSGSYRESSTIDFASLQASWVNSDGSDIFGSATAFTSTAEFTSTSSFAPESSFSSFRADSASSIHDAARITDWDGVLELCASNPEYAKFSGVDGWTALHHACNRRCPRPEVIEALINAYPDALMAAEAEKGWLPLHYACRFKAPRDAVSLLQTMKPEMGKIAVTRKDRMGRTPLYYAVRYEAPPGVVGLLLAVNPGAVLEEDQYDESPLALVWNNWADKLDGRRLVKSFLPGGFPEPEGVTEQERTRQLWTRLRAHRKLHERWGKVNMLLKAAFGFPLEERNKGADVATASIGSERKWRILHAVSAVKCHLSLFLLACALHPEQAQELDESDLRRPSDPMLTGISTHQTALHLAASSNAGGESGKIVIQDLLDLNRNAAHVQDAVDGSLPLHCIVENEYKQDWANFGSLLCHVYPRALQIPDHNGKLPLHRAAVAIKHSNERGEDYMRTSVIMNVVRLFPQGASHVDNSGCLPFHFLAMNAEEWDENVESVYNAHRAAVQARCGATFDLRLPVHLAASNVRARESLIARFVRLHPRGVCLQDRQGKLPLHLCCELGKDWDQGVSAIYEAFPGAVEDVEGNERGWTCLHMAAHCSNSSSALIEKLVELNPAAAACVDRNWRYALHLACDAGKKWDSGLETLFNANPSSLASADRHGLLPLHIAALHCCATAHHHKDDKKSYAVLAPEDTTEEAREVCLRDLDNIYQLLRANPSVL